MVKVNRRPLACGDVRVQFVARKDLELLHYAETPADAFERLRAHLIAHALEPQSAQESAAPGIARTRG